MNYFHAVREFVAPLADKSNFANTGLITPQEFVEAGDFLVYKCPTWKWSAGDPTKRKSYLPKDKQYLVTRNVPCAQRCEDGKNYYPETHEGEWTVYEDPAQEEILPVELDKHGQIRSVSKNIDVENNVYKNDVKEDMPLIDDDEFYDMEHDDMLTTSNSSNIIKTRTYDVYITWDKWYQTPRVWLFGYNEDKMPLTNKEMFEDVSPEHAQKTVTYEYHPNENYMALSIHPCKHAHVMKKLIRQRLEATGNKKTELRADQYLCIFLKFMGSVIPTISYDYSLAL